MGFLRNLPKFFRQVWLELRRVVWPTRQQTLVFTAVVFASVIFVSVMLWIVDAALGQVMSFIIR